MGASDPRTRLAQFWSSFRERLKDGGPFGFLNGVSGWAFFCAMLSSFGLAGFYSTLLRSFLPDWFAVGLLMAPITIILIIQWEYFPDRIVARAHTIAAVWFTILALGMEVGELFGYHPMESNVFRVMAHLGWTFAWAGIYRRARARSRQLAEQGATTDDGSASTTGESAGTERPPTVT